MSDAYFLEAYFDFVSYLFLLMQGRAPSSLAKTPFLSNIKSVGGEFDSQSVGGEFAPNADGSPQ